MTMVLSLKLWCLLLALQVCHPVAVLGDPNSKPYIPFRTDPTDHPFVKHRLEWNDNNRSDRRRSTVKEYNPSKDEDSNRQCPLHFTLGVSRRAHHKAQNSNAFAIVKPPIVHPVFPARGPGRQLIHTTLYEHLDLLSPEIAASRDSSSSTVIKEGLIQHQDFPLLFESSSFAYTSPIVHDVNGDSIPDAILTDYDGGIFIVGLHQGKDTKRWFHKAQVPRIFVRRNWVEARVNATYKDLHPEEAEQLEKKDGETPPVGVDSREPYHSYFEYSSTSSSRKDVLQGVTANVLGQKRDDLDALKDRRERKPSLSYAVKLLDEEEGEEEEEEEEEVPDDPVNVHRRLMELDDGDQQSFIPGRRLQEVSLEESDRDLEISFPRRRLQEVDAQEQQRQEEERKRQEDEARQRQNEEEDRRRKEAEQKNLQEDEEQRRRQQEEEERRRQEEEKQRQQQQEEEKRRQEDEQRTRQEQEEQGKRQEEEQRNREEQERQERERKEHEEQEKEKEQKTQQQEQRQDSAQVDRKIELDNPSDTVRSTEGQKQVGEDLEGSEDEASSSGRVDAGDDESPRGDDDASGPEAESNSLGDDRAPPDIAHGDDMYGHAGGYDDYYGRYKSYRDDFYDEKHYVRINPHILATPTLAEVPKLYGNDGEVEDILFVPVSYYLDEDEYEGHLSYRRFENTDAGDETEVQRGMYVASAIMLYHLSADPRWGRQEHLDLSTDHSSPQNATLLGRIPVREDNTRMGAFALSKPAVADIDGDGKFEVIIGTSMGLVYAFDCTHMTMKNNWPIQMPHAVESPIIVEDVTGNTKLETYVADIGGNVACFDEEAKTVWQRDLRAAVSDGPSTVRASSPMTLGDVNGDGVLDIVISLQVLHEGNQKETTYVFAMNAANGGDLPNFPIAFDTPISLRSKPGENWVHEQLPGLLLVDLHSDQSHIQAYIHRKKDARTSRSTSAGGNVFGLHIVFPIGETLYIVEAGSGCIQSFGVGEDMVAMVQVDDVHGSNNLDLVVSTTAGNIITFESSAPYHPLNVWNNGDSRGRLNNYAHGFSASQGIFVHAVSREYRDIFGVFVPVTFEIFDKRPNIENEPDKKVYKVEIRDGTSSKRAMWRSVYNETGVYTERLYIPHGAGYYSLMVQLRGSNGLIYEDMFHVGYNVNYMDGFGLMLWLPLLLAAVTIFLGSSRNVKWGDDDYEGRDRNGAGLGILG